MELAREWIGNDIDKLSLMIDNSAYGGKLNWHYSAYPEGGFQEGYIQAGGTFVIVHRDTRSVEVRSIVHVVTDVRRESCIPESVRCNTIEVSSNTYGFDELRDLPLYGAILARFSDGIVCPSRRPKCCHCHVCSSRH